jgi:hypothetical protein
MFNILGLLLSATIPPEKIVISFAKSSPSFK